METETFYKDERWALTGALHPHGVVFNYYVISCLNLMMYDYYEYYDNYYYYEEYNPFSWYDYSKQRRSRISERKSYAQNDDKYVDILEEDIGPNEKGYEITF